MFGNFLILTLKYSLTNVLWFFFLLCSQNWARMTIWVDNLFPRKKFSKKNFKCLNTNANRTRNKYSFKEMMLIIQFSSPQLSKSDKNLLGLQALLSTIELGVRTAICSVPVVGWELGLLYNVLRGCLLDLWDSRTRDRAPKMYLRKCVCVCV